MSWKKKILEKYQRQRQRNSFYNKPCRTASPHTTEEAHYLI